MADTQTTNTTQTFADVNREHWDRVADKVFKQQWVLDMHAQIVEHITANIPWLSLPDATGRDSKMLDYACGNGILTETFHPHFSRVIGVDLSEAMIAGYRERMARLGLPESRAIGVRGDLLALQGNETEPPLSEQDLSEFDFATICLALHHVEDAALAVRQLAKRLRPGGVLLVVEFADDWHAQAADNGHEHGHGHGHGDHSHAHNHHHEPPAASDDLPSASHTIAHYGFSEEAMRGLFEQAGFGDISYVTADKRSPVPPSKTGDVLLSFSRARKLE